MAREGTGREPQAERDLEIEQARSTLAFYRYFYPVSVFEWEEEDRRLLAEARATLRRHGVSWPDDGMFFDMRHY